MAMNKKTTLVIDHEAEQKAKQQAMERELAGDQHAKKTEIIKDNSVETNKSELKKIKSWTAKSVLIVVGICALIGLIVWSVLYKAHLDKKAAEEAKRKKAEAVAVEKSRKVLSGELTDKEKEQCGLKDGVYINSAQYCSSKLQYEKLNSFLKDSIKNLPDEEKNSLFRKKLHLAKVVHGQNPKEYVKILDAIKSEFDSNGADYDSYYGLAESYLDVNRKKALAAFQESKKRRDELLKNKPESILEIYSYPENDKQIDELFNNVTKIDY